MQKISKLQYIASALKTSSFKLMAVRAQPFSHQSDLSSFDFTDKLNVEELKLKNPTQT